MINLTAKTVTLLCSMELSVFDVARLYVDQERCDKIYIQCYSGAKFHLWCKINLKFLIQIQFDIINFGLTLENTIVIEKKK